MSLIRIAIAALLAALAGSSAASDLTKGRPEAAFGFVRGMTLKEAKAVAPLQAVPVPNTYFTESPPKPDAALKAYVVGISPKVGLCRVMGGTVPGKREQAVEWSHALKDTLVSRYGPPVETAEDNGTSVFVWDEPQGPKTKIVLSAEEGANGIWATALNYFFSNFEVCEKELAASK